MPASASPSDSPSISASASPSVSASASASVSPSASASRSPSVSPSASASNSPSVSPSVSPSASASVSPSPSPSASLPVITEDSILDIVYAMYEGDTTGWGSTSDEYLSARTMVNAAINRWEFYEQTQWRELFKELDDADATVTKTVTSGTFDYTCPKDMVRPASYVRTVDSAGTSTFWIVEPISKVPTLVKETYRYCYFSGSIRTGFTLHFNPLMTLNTGDTIKYEYYKSATRFTTTTSTTEMSDPYFIVYFVLSRLYENDGEDGKASKAFQEAEARLESMRVQNMIGLENIDDLIQDDGLGFGN